MELLMYFVCLVHPYANNILCFHYQGITKFDISRTERQSNIEHIVSYIFATEEVAHIENQWQSFGRLRKQLASIGTIS